MVQLIITGGLGFLGQQAARHFLRRGAVWNPAFGTKTPLTQLTLFDQGFPNEPLPEEITDDEHLSEMAATMKVGDRCEVIVGGKRGVVQYVGKIPQIKPGWWIGVQYDEPVGKNDGTVKGRRYFECPPKYGGFLRPDKLLVGDYPELDDLFDDSDADDEGDAPVVS